jgi:hypothetical protein
MDDYKKMLNSLDMKTLKGFVKQYMSHLKITTSKKTKDELIEHIMKHTELRNGKVVLKDVEFDTPKAKTKEIKEVKDKKVKERKEQKYKKINEEYLKLDKERNQISEKLKKDPEPEREQISFQEGRKKYKVKSKSELSDILSENRIKEYKVWRERNKNLIERENEINKQIDILFKEMGGVPFSSYYTGRIKEAGEILLKYALKGDLNKYEKSQVEYYTNRIKELEKELAEYYPELVKKK